MQVSGASSSHPHGVVEGLRCPLAEVELVCDFPFLFATFGSAALLLGLHILLRGLASLCRWRLVWEVSQLRARSSLLEVDLRDTRPLKNRPVMCLPKLLFPPRQRRRRQPPLRQLGTG